MVNVLTITGRATINTNAYKPSTHILFSFCTIQEGKAMPKLIALGPSGLPYKSQFFLASSSVKAYKLNTTIEAVQKK